MSRISIFSFFAGAGFLDLGFETNGYEVVYVNEIHPGFMKSYIHAREKLGLPKPEFGYFQGDISELLEPVNAQNLADMIHKCRQKNKIVGFIGGPPCPDFSVAGKNRGRWGENGILSSIYVELICRHRPSFFLFENVKGLWSTRKHRVFYEELKHHLHENDYVTTERLVNALEYGVPQFRERIILIGFQRDFLTELGFTLDETINTLGNMFPWQNEILYQIDQVLQYPWPTTDPFIESSERSMPEGIPKELTVQHWFEKNDVTKHPNASQFFKPRAGIAKFSIIDEGDDSRKSYKRLHRWRYSPTAAYGNNEVHLHPYKLRRISVAEALAIQSLPKEFELPLDISLTDAFKTVGNGVPYLVSKALAKNIRDFLGVPACD